MVMTRQAAEAKLTQQRARHYAKSKDGARFVFYVASRGVYVAIDGLGDGRVRWSEHASCPVCE